MNIAFVSANRPGSWKTDLANAFTTLGHDVTPHSDADTPRRPDADLVVWAFHHGRGLNFTPDVGITMDLWLGVPKRERRMLNLNPRVRNFWHAKHVFSSDGSPYHADRFVELGINHHWLPPACPSRLNYFGDPNSFPTPPRIAFVGARNHWNPLRAQMIDLLTARYGQVQFRWYGPGSPWRELRDDDLNSLYASGTILIGDTMGVDYYWSDRMPRTLGQGGFIIQADTAGFGTQGFFNGITHATWDGKSLEGLVDQLDYYLDKPIRRFEIQGQAIKVVRERHLWEHRAKQILDTVVL